MIINFVLVIFLQVALSNLKRRPDARLQDLGHFFPISTVHFSMARKLLVDFQSIPTVSLKFQVTLNLGENTPLNLVIVPLIIAFLTDPVPIVS